MLIDYFSQYGSTAPPPQSYGGDYGASGGIACFKNKNKIKGRYLSGLFEEIDDCEKITVEWYLQVFFRLDLVPFLVLQRHLHL